MIRVNILYAYHLIYNWKGNLALGRDIGWPHSGTASLSASSLLLGIKVGIIVVKHKLFHEEVVWSTPEGYEPVSLKAVTVTNWRALALGRWIPAANEWWSTNWCSVSFKNCGKSERIDVGAILYRDLTVLVCAWDQRRPIMDAFGLRIKWVSYRGGVSIVKCDTGLLRHRFPYADWGLMFVEWRVWVTYITQQTAILFALLLKKHETLRERRWKGTTIGDTWCVSCWLPLQTDVLEWGGRESRAIIVVHAKWVSR